jgi:plasmid stability protein
MPEQTTERKIHIRVEEGLHRRLRIRCAEHDTTIQDFVARCRREDGSQHTVSASEVTLAVMGAG